MSKRSAASSNSKSGDIRNFFDEKPEVKKARTEKAAEESKSASDYKESLLATLVEPGWKVCS